jgi:hypothetical protein
MVFRTASLWLAVHKSMKDAPLSAEFTPRAVAPSQ